MATRQRRLEIVIAWMQEHPHAVRDVQSKLNALAGSYGYLRRNIGKLNLTSEEQATFMEELTKTYQDMRVRAGANQKTVNMLNKTLKATSAVMGKTTAAGGIFNKIFQRMGYRTSWIGFRMAIMGRIILRSVLAPMQKMTGVLTNWEKSMETVALALALQEAGMGEAGMSAEELMETLMNLAEEGPKMQTAMAGLQSTWAALATENAPALNSILGEMQRALEGVGGAIITSMVEAVDEALPWLGDFLDLLEPVADAIGTLTGYLIPFAAGMTIIGMAIYLAKPALLALQYLLNPIVLALTAGIVLILLWKRYWGDWAAYMENVVFPIMDALQEPFWEPFKMFMKGVGGLQEFFGGGTPPGSRETKQEIDLDVNIDIENLLGEIDLDEMITRTTDAVADAVRRASP